MRQGVGMIEADVWRAVILALRSGLDNYGLPTVKIKQSYQPWQQGLTESCVYLHKILSRRVGHQGREYVYSQENDNLAETERYWLSTTIQLNAIIDQDVDDTASMTAFDVVELCGAILQTAATRQSLLSIGISIENITDIRQAFGTDDRDRFRLDASVDFTLLYEQELTGTVPKLYPINPDFKRV